MKVIVPNKNQKFLDKLDEKTRLRLIQVLEYLETNPTPYSEFDLEKMAGPKHVYRIRKGDFRIVYYISNETGQIIITDITRREQAYK